MYMIMQLLQLEVSCLSAIFMIILIVDQHHICIISYDNIRPKFAISRSCRLGSRASAIVGIMFSKFAVGNGSNLNQTHGSGKGQGG